jgi:hypothetical protein
MQTDRQTTTASLQRQASSSFMSRQIILPGVWPTVMPFMPLSMTASWGVTPHPQNTGTSPARISTGSPKSGLERSDIPRAFAWSNPCERPDNVTVAISEKRRGGGRFAATYPGYGLAVSLDEWPCDGAYTLYLVDWIRSHRDDLVAAEA